MYAPPTFEKYVGELKMEVVARLNEFDPASEEDLPEHFFCIFYGLRKSGKTVMMRYMLKEMEQRLKDHEVFLFSATAEVNPEQYDFVPKKAKFPDITQLEIELGKIVGKQSQKFKEFHEDGGEEPKPILIILDDCVSEEIVRHSPSLNKLAVSGRHIYMSVIILSQVVSGSGSVPPIIRTQADAIFVVANPRAETERNLLAINYLTPSNDYGGKSKALKVLEAATSEQYRALVIVTNDSSARLYQEYLFLYGPVEEHVELKLGTQEQWADSGESSVGSRKRRRLTDSKAKMERIEKLPDPFGKTPSLPIDKKGDYLNGLSDTGRPGRMRTGRRR